MINPLRISVLVLFALITFIQSVFAAPPRGTDIYKNSVGSMLYIETQNKMGSGVIVKEDGTFVTCFHVIADANYINAKLNDGSVFEVNGFRYINPLEDIAILTLDTKQKFRPIQVNSSNSPEIGGKVFALSNPQGLQFSISDGMLNQFTDKYIQFSAPVSTGSSGGALLDEKGSLIGIIDAQLQDAQNINFAVPNKFWYSKLDNIEVYNKENMRWIDFLVLNADKEQFKMYSAYAYAKMKKDADFIKFYEYLRPFGIYYTRNGELPDNLYSVFGLFALLADEQEFEKTGKHNRIFIEEAHKYYQNSYNKKQNTEAALLALVIIYNIKRNITLRNLFLDTLKTDYPHLYSKINMLIIDNVNNKDGRIKMLQSLVDITNFEGISFCANVQ